MSISGVPSRQSSPRTSSTPSSTPISATRDNATGFGRTGERRAKVPSGSPPRGVWVSRSRRA